MVPNCRGGRISSRICRTIGAVGSRACFCIKTRRGWRTPCFRGARGLTWRHPPQESPRNCSERRTHPQDRHCSGRPGGGRARTTRYGKPLDLLERLTSQERSYGTKNQRGSRSGLSPMRDAGGADYRTIRELARHLSAVRGLRPDLGGAERRAGLSQRDPCSRLA